MCRVVRFFQYGILCFLLSGCFFGYIGKVDSSDENLYKVAVSFQTVIDSLERYKKDKGSYPLDIFELKKGYLKYLTAGEYKSVVFNGKTFIYSNAEHSEMIGRETWGGYQIKIGDIREFTVGIPESVLNFIYRPSGAYPYTERDFIVKCIGKWALIRRSIGLRFDPEHPGSQEPFCGGGEKH